MLQIGFIRENQEKVIKALAKRNIDAQNMIDEVIALDEERRNLQTQLDGVLAESNSLSKEIGGLFKSGEVQKANILKEKTSQLKEESKVLGEQLNKKVEALDQLLYKIPNVPNELVPIGNSEKYNEQVYRDGDIPELAKMVFYSGNAERSCIIYASGLNYRYEFDENNQQSIVV